MLTANSAGFFTVPAHGSQPPLPYLTKILLFCQSSAFCKVWVRDVDLLPTEPLPPSGCCMCIAPASPRDCNRASQDHACGPESKCPSPKAVICWAGRSICRGAPAGREGCPTHTAQGRHLHSSKELVAALQLFFLAISKQKCCCIVTS